MNEDFGTGDGRGDIIGGAAVSDAMARLAAELDAILGAPKGAADQNLADKGTNEAGRLLAELRDLETVRARRHRLACRYGWTHAGAARAARLENPWRKLIDGMARIARDYPGAFDPPAPSIVRRLVIQAAPRPAPLRVPAIDGRAAWLASVTAARSGAGRVWNVRTFKVGGLRFVRVGDLQISTCRTRKPF